MTVTRTHAIGAALDRIEGHEKVTGAAKYATSTNATTSAMRRSSRRPSRGARSDRSTRPPAIALPGVLAVLSCENAPRLHEVDDVELALFQSPRVAYRGAIATAVVAESYETARQAERLVGIQYAEEPYDVELRLGHPGLYKPATINPSLETDTEEGDVDAALAAAEVTVDRTYES